MRFAETIASFIWRLSIACRYLWLVCILPTILKNSENLAKHQCLIFPMLSFRLLRIEFQLLGVGKNVNFFIVLLEEGRPQYLMMWLNFYHTEGAQALPCGQNALSDVYGFVFPLVFVKPQPNRRALSGVFAW